MFNFSRLFLPKKMLGIDIGTFAIKVVEISGAGAKKKLENYAYVAPETSGSATPDPQALKNLSSNASVTKIIKELLQQARIKTKEAVFAVPDFSTFCTSFEMPPMTLKEVPEAIRYNAAQYITLPMADVTLDWRVAPKFSTDKNSPYKVFLVAIPNQVIEEYRQIARDAGLVLHAVEAESLSLARGFRKNIEALQVSPVVCLVDIGVKSSVINIIDQGFLKQSYSFSFDSTKFVQASQQTMEQNITSLVEQVNDACAEFARLEKRDVSQVCLAGGLASLPGLKESVAKATNKQVSVSNCFSELVYPAPLHASVQSIGPSFAVAIGAATAGLEA